MQCFFDFFMTAPSKTPSFEGGTPPGDSRNGSKTYGSAWDVIEKVEKTSGDSCGGTGTSKSMSLQINHNSIANPSQIRRKSTTNLSRILRKSVTNPSQIHHKSIANPSQIHRKSIANPMGQTCFSDGTNLFIRWDTPSIRWDKHFYPMGQTCVF